MIDGSGSMLALDGDPDRIADARARALEVRSELPSGGIASVIEIGPEPRVLLSASSDIDAFSEAVAATRATSGRADFAAAFTLADGLETAEMPIGFVLLSDAGSARKSSDSFHLERPMSRSDRRPPTEPSWNWMLRPVQLNCMSAS